MYSPHSTVAGGDLHALLPSLDEWLEDGAHRGMEELLNEGAVLALRDAVRVTSGKT